MNPENKQRTRRILVSGLISGSLFTYFFVEQPPGISVPLFVGTILSLLVWSTPDLGRRLSRQNLWLLLPVILSSIPFAIYENPILLLLNLAILILFTLLSAHFMTGGDPTRQSLWSYLFIPPHVISGQIEKPFPIVQAEVDLDAWQLNYRRYWLPTLRGILIATPLLLMFMVLMLSADIVFAQLLRQLLHIELDIALGRWLRNSALAVLTGWLFAGWIMYAAKPYAEREIHLPERLLRRVCRSLRIGPIETNTILTLLTGLFALFVTVQFAYLFGGLDHINLNGISYSEYARRGYFELISVAVLALGVILILRKITRFLSQRGRLIFRFLSTLIIGFTLVVLLSAFKRMFLYEQAFGFTELRLYVHVSIIWLAIVLLWFIFTLWTRPHAFAVGALVAAVGFVGTLNILHPEAFVVRQNFARYNRTGELDVAYLSTLSADAAPLLIAELSKRTVQPVESCRLARPLNPLGIELDLDPRGGGRIEICSSPPDFLFLERQLARQANRFDSPTAAVGWPAAHFGRYRAQQALQKYFQNQ